MLKISGMKRIALLLFLILAAPLAAAPVVRASGARND